MCRCAVPVLRTVVCCLALGLLRGSSASGSQLEHIEFRPFPGTVTTSHAEGSSHSSTLPLELSFFDPDVAIDLESVAVVVDGEEVTSEVVLKLIRYGFRISMPLDLCPGWPHDYAVLFRELNSSQNPFRYTARFFSDVRGEGDFLVELEDFNYSKGEFKSSASRMPYEGLAYKGESSSNGVDYYLGSPSEDFPNNYREGEKPNVPLLPGSDRERSGYRVNGSWVLAAEPGDWFNYTRHFPTNFYEVYAAVARGGLYSEAPSGKLLIVSNPKHVDQVTVTLGQFNGFVPRGWDVNVLVPLTEGADSQPKVIGLGGPTTLRFECGRGQADYLVFVPVRQIEFIRFRQKGGTIDLEWTGDAVLESAGTVTEDYLPVANVSGQSASVPIAWTGHHFFRLRPRSGTPPCPRPVDEIPD